MWSKVGRFVEVLHIVGDILTKISVNCVINYMLYYYLHIYFYGFILCAIYNCLYIYGIACICLFLFQYESVHL
jgi:mannose/fructose/N-acetylgalactosamine-specific phosphotransferase system component IIC